jgi:porin
LGNWGGLRTTLEDSGITPQLTLVTDVAGNPSGGQSQGLTQASSIGLSSFFDLDKISGLKGGSVFASFSYRWGNNLSKEYIGNFFSTQQIYGFETIRLIDLSYQQQLFDDHVEIRLGRFPAADDFLVSAYNCGFMQNAFCGTPVGIIFDAPGMSAYYGTWAALVKVKPTAQTYVMTGVYNGDTTIRAHSNHQGVDFSLKGPLFAIGEFGYQINGLPGDGPRLGNYKLGVWYDDHTLTDFESGADTRGSWGVYGLFDQVLVPFGNPGSNRGFGVFGSVIVAPDPHIQQMPVFFTAGVSARGLFDARPSDVVGLAVASGYFSENLQRAQQEEQLQSPVRGVPDYETAIELNYRFAFRERAVFIQPDLQYIIQSGGTGHFNNVPGNVNNGTTHYNNALVLGVQLGINF